MARDRLNFNLMYLEPNMDLEVGGPIDSIGVSQVRPYLAATFGEDVPHDPRLRSAADRALDTATALSIDEELDTFITKEKITKFVPNFLKLAEPMVGATKFLGKVVNEKITDFERDLVGKSRAEVDDLTYGAGMFDALTIMTSVQLDISHPRYGVTAVNKALEEVKPANQSVIPTGDVNNPSALTLLLATPLVKTEHRRKIDQLRQQAKRMNNDTEFNRERLSRILPLVQLAFDMRYLNPESQN